MRVKFVVAIPAVIMAAVVVGVVLSLSSPPRPPVPLPQAHTFTRLSPVAAVAEARNAEAGWEAQLKAGAAAAPARSFPNPSIASLRARLRRLGRQCHFSIVALRVLRPRQQAPLVIVQSSNEQALSADTPLILQVVDPKKRTNDDRTGWSYEAFFFEAENASGVPFLATFNWWRGRHPGGGQWAADPNLYPFAHG